VVADKGANLLGKRIVIRRAAQVHGDHPSSLRSGRDVRHIASFENTPVKMILVGYGDALTVRTGRTRVDIAD
jgi:hypothetical protein